MVQRGTRVPGVSGHLWTGVGPTRCSALVSGPKLRSMNALSSAYAIAVTGLRAADARLAVSANNTANVNTDGFEPSTTDLSDLGSGGVRVSISEAARSRATGGTDLIQENLSQTLAGISYRANVKTLGTAQDLDATLLGLGLRGP